MKAKTLPLLLLLSGIVISCEKLMPGAPPDEETLAGPLEGLTPGQMASHIQGDEEFARAFGAHEGLGPVFVSTSCESCHIGDGKGHPLTVLTRFGRYSGNAWDPLENMGGPQLQHRAISGYAPEVIPSQATGITRLMAPAVTGLGFLEAIPDSAILALADPFDSNGDGISGVPNYVTPPPYFIPELHHVPKNGKYIGRFGKKAAAINLLEQTSNAYLNDIGITSDFNPRDLYNPANGHFTGDGVADPEVPASTVHNVVFYLRTLKAPPRRITNELEITIGQEIFKQIGCASCHFPSFTTGKSEIAALSQKSFAPYTDLLLHDMGPELDDGYTEGEALTSEWRTAPLWGLGLAEGSQGGRTFFLHDGRARTIEEAIGYHGGEAASSRDKFNKLTEGEKQKLLRFLKSL